MSKAKQIGTAAETAVVKYFTEVMGWPDVARVVLHGKDDEGDIHVGPTNNPRIIFEVKSRKNECTYKEVEEFMKELDDECKHTWGENYMLHEPYRGYLIIKRPGKGKVEDWWLCWKPISEVESNEVTVRCRLGDYFKPEVK